MRWFFAGMLMLLISGATALAQATGDVEVVGFGNNYRGDCWTSMVVRLRPETSATATFTLQVVQEDLDRDRVRYERQITLTGNSEGAGVREQRYWMYFIPEATRHVSSNPGLPDLTYGRQGLAEALKVYLIPQGKPPILLNITSTATAIEPYVGGGNHRGKKLILMVSDPDSGSQAVTPFYEDVLGILEEAEMVTVRPADLPENVLGYEAVDAVVMVSVDPSNLKNPTDERMRALRQYVREGGNLVLCQHPQWEKMIGWGDLLPVNYPRFGEAEPFVQGVAQRDDLYPLRDWVKSVDRSDQWGTAPGPFKAGVAEAKSGTLVEEWMQWPDKGLVPKRTPYLVRSVSGLGAVTWVAQNLGDPAITVRCRVGWEKVWDKVFGWKNDPKVRPSKLDKGAQDSIDEAEQTWAKSTGVDLGASLLGFVEHGGRGAALVFLAIVFFILYWVAAGPIGYLVLAAKGKAGLSWFIFAASAIFATLFTVGVVKLVLRGDPEVKHLTVVRMSPGQPAVIYSRIGLYIPRDGPQELALSGAASDAVSYISPLAIHPQYTTDNQFPQYMNYTVPVRDATNETPPSLEAPYRSTLKKFQAKWVGNPSIAIDGSAKLLESTNGYIGGSLTNATGRDLRNIYFAFRHPAIDPDKRIVSSWTDYLLYLPTWKKGESFELRNQFDAPFLREDKDIIPGRDKRLRARLSGEWEIYWYPPFRGGMNEKAWKDDADAAPRSMPMLSLFDRLIPAKMDQARGINSRFELLRRGGRYLDLSPAELNGGLIVLAQSDDDHAPLPFPLTVDGQKVAGQGRIYYQAVIPLDRSELEKALEVPATQPTNP